MAGRGAAAGGVYGQMIPFCRTPMDVSDDTVAASAFTVDTIVRV